MANLALPSSDNGATNRLRDWRGSRQHVGLYALSLSLVAIAFVLRALLAPTLGEQALYLGRRRNAYIMGLSLEDSDRLLEEIWSYAESAVYRHKWAVGDLVLWDNRTTMHRRDAFDPNARRIMHRTQIKGSHAPKRAAL